MDKYYVMFSFDANGKMSVDISYVLADNYQEALKLAYVLAEQRYWLKDSPKDLFGITVSKMEKNFEPPHSPI